MSGLSERFREAARRTGLDVDLVAEAGRLSPGERRYVLDLASAVRRPDLAPPPRAGEPGSGIAFSSPRGPVECANPECGASLDPGDACELPSRQGGIDLLCMPCALAALDHREVLERGTKSGARMLTAARNVYEAAAGECRRLAERDSTPEGGGA